MHSTKNKGWFATWRSLLDSDLWLKESFTRGQAWIDLVGLARFEDGVANIKGRVIELQRAQLAWSERGLAKRWKWSRDKVRRFLEELETNQQINRIADNVTSVITVTNYDQYQSPNTTKLTTRSDAQPQNAPLPIPQNQPQNININNINNSLKTCSQFEGNTTERSAFNTTDKTRNNNITIKQPPPRGWVEVELSLEECGVSAASKAITTAKGRGASACEISQLIDEYQSKPGAWQPGALYARVTGKLTKWPEPSVEYQRKQQRRAQTESALKHREQNEQAKAQKQTELRHLDQLEQCYGEQLDALSELVQAKLLAAAIPDPKHRELTGKTGRRFEMLEHLSQMDGKVRV